MSSTLSRQLALSIKDPALASLWLLKVPFADFQVEVVAEKVQPTFNKTPANPRFNQGSNSYYPGITDIDGLSISFYEQVDYPVSMWLNTWRKLVFNPEDGVYGMPSVYKQDIVIDYFAANSSSPIKTATYSGCWPTDKAPFNLDYESAEGRIMVEAQFSVDTMTWD